MAADYRKIKVTWSALFALLLLSGWLTPAVALALPAPVECGMECCLTSGHCCCLDRYNEHLKEHPESEPNPQLIRFRESCPPGCATSPSTFSLHFKASAQPPVPGDEPEPDCPAHRQNDYAPDDPLFGQLTPRAPPLSLIDFIA
ncbi:MAG: hypothetical protein U0Z53_04790 [Blastocatellia bacterium]